MKNIKNLLLIILLVSLSGAGRAQVGIISTVAGNGGMGAIGSGNGGLALNANLGSLWCMAVDDKDNIYIGSYYSGTVRKVSASGIITKIAGNGSSTFSGDGGQATAAGFSYGSLEAVAADNLGNVYLSDDGTRIRKINTSGIINTIAGTGTYGDSGDGGPASAAAIRVNSIEADRKGNLYFSTSEYSYSCIRKIDPSGMITRFAGTNTAGFSGDGGPATAAQINFRGGFAIDKIGNVYIADSANHRVRKIDTFGIITTIAGNGHAATAGDGGYALDASIYYPRSVAVDTFGNVYVFDSRYRVRKINKHGLIITVAGNGTSGYSGDGGIGSEASINPWGDNGIVARNSDLLIMDEGTARVRSLKFQPDIETDSFGVFFQKKCKGIKFVISTKRYASSYTIKTKYGDGLVDSLPTISFGTSGALITEHSYATPGTYQIKHYLKDGSAIIDSVSYPYVYTMCNNLPIAFYADITGTCIYNSATSKSINWPIQTRVDSNGVTIDTLSTMYGFFYQAYGRPGDIYTFKLLNNPTLLPITCPATGIIIDTIKPAVDTQGYKYMGFACTSGAGTDLIVNTVIPVTGIRDQWGNIYVRNLSCNSTDATVTLHFSPKYIYTGGALPTPISVTSTSLTWNIPSVSMSMPNLTFDIYYVIWYNPSTGLLTANDTVQTYVQVTPITGDINPANNFNIIIDTVSASCDPNEIWVSPQGHIPDGTQLTYTVNFINTGNDTAFNIYVMDTLSDFLDPKSFRVLFASKEMNVTKLWDNIEHNILRFDFDNINLLDSSHHTECDAAFSFTINTKTGLPHGSAIPNRVGIFFDNNPVVMTNTVEDIIWKPVGVKEIEGSKNNSEHILIYPNPTNDEIAIKSTSSNLSGYLIYNTMGQLMMEGQLAGSLTKLSIKNLPTGVYYIVVKGDGGNIVEKLMKW